MSKIRAVLTLFGFFLLFLTFAVTAIPPVPRTPDNRRGDVATFQTVVSRLRAGEPYYGVLGDELRRRGYTTRDAFNWRTPLLLITLSRVADGVSRAALIGLGVVLFCMTVLVALRQSPWAAGGGAFMQAGVVLFLVVPSGAVLGETWAGVLIGLSVCMYARERPNSAALLGLLALFVRELAAPYCVVCTISAALGRRWREVGMWVSGASLYAIYYGWHLLNVWAQRQPTDLGFESSWVEMGGLPFLLMKAQWQGWLLVSPPWVTALALTLVIGGIAAIQAPVQARLTSSAYVGFFLVAGKLFNGYWGLIAWPTWALTCGYGVDLLRQSVRALLAPPQHR